LFANKELVIELINLKFSELGFCKKDLKPFYKIVETIISNVNFGSIHPRSVACAITRLFVKENEIRLSQMQLCKIFNISGTTCRKTEGLIKKWVKKKY